jgi:hypothetical protein
MKKMMGFAILLLGFVDLAAPIQAAQQGASQEIKQRVTKRAREVATHARIQYGGQPRFVAIQETSISYATNTPEEVVNFENNFYSFVEDVWLMSPSAQGPWRAAPYVPEVVTAIVCTQLSTYPLNPYQLCALPWTSGLSYTVWKPS